MAKDATNKEEKAVLKFVRGHNGEQVSWVDFAKAVGVGPSRLGTIVKGLLERGAIQEPAGEGSLVYAIPEPTT